MERFYFSYVFVLGLNSVILGTGFAIFLFRLRHKQTHTWLLAAVILCFTLMISLFGIMLTVADSGSIFTFSAIVGIDVSIAILVQFAYHFPENDKPREARLVLMLSAPVPFISVFLLIWSLPYDSQGWYVSFNRVMLTAIAFQILRIFAIFWLFAIWLRRILAYERSSSASLLQKLLWPGNPTAITIRAFVVTFSLTAFLPISIVCVYLGFLDLDQLASLFVGIIILIFVLFFFTYINYQPEQTSFIVKLVGTTLVFVLAAITTTGYMGAREARRAYDAQRLRDLEACREWVRAHDKPNLPADIRYIRSRPIEGGPARVSYNNADTGGLDPKQIADWDSILNERQVSMAALARRLTGSDPGQALADARAQLAAQPAKLGTPLVRAPDRAHLKLSEKDLHYDFQENGRHYEVGFSYLAFRRYMHSINLTLVVIMLSSTVVVLVFFPLLFHRGLLRPLTALLAGVRKVNQGDLSISVPIHAGDEIGFVARAFNTMVASIGLAREKALAQERERVRLEAENERKSLELEEARRLQLSMLPKQMPDLPGLSIAAYTNPATEVGGDYYDFYVEEQGMLTIVIGDATGHGLRAGTMVAATKSLFNVLAPTHDPIPLLEQTSRALTHMGFETMLMALQVVQVRQNHLTMTAAGMPFALLYKARDATVTQVVLKGLPLGSGFTFPYQLSQLDFEPGDTLLLLSDGLEERFNHQDKMLGPTQIRNRFAEIASGPPHAIIENLVALGASWAEGRAQDDDITLVVLKKHGVEAG